MPIVDICQVVATVGQRYVAVTPAGQDVAVRFPTALVHRTVMIVATATEHWRHPFVSVLMGGLVMRVS